MAAGTRLEITFDTMGGSKTASFAYAKPGATETAVKALAQAIIANGSIFQNPPIRATAAKTVTTSENVYDLS